MKFTTQSYRISFWLIWLVYTSKAFVPLYAENSVARRNSLFRSRTCRIFGGKRRDHTCGGVAPMSTTNDLSKQPAEEEDPTSKNERQLFTSLASSFLVEMTHDETNDVDTWSLFPICDVVAPQLSKTSDRLKAEGAQAWAALHTTESVTDDDVINVRVPSFVMKCQWCTDSEELQVSLTKSSDNNNDDSDLIGVLSRILVQWTTSRRRQRNKDSATTSTKIQLPKDDKNEELTIKDINSEGGVRRLFNIPDSSEVELVEMVDRNGQALGMAPRNLVHTFNLLHRGIGMFVCKKEKGHDFNWDGSDMGDLYVHRRTDTKRIFPSLYDMFVGGVSTAGEESVVTARREVSEELGLTEALNDNNKRLSDPLFQCVVCTAYNRCVVTMFGYMMDPETETISWQEEEVAWGDFVPYPIIEASADRSIQRFAAKNEWPGFYPPIQSKRKGAMPESLHEDDKDWTEWDYVPDGLLVWEAWLLYINCHHTK